MVPPPCATAASACASDSAAARRGTRSGGRKGVSHGTIIRYGMRVTLNTLATPASGPRASGHSSVTTVAPSAAYSSTRRLALTMSSPTCGSTTPMTRLTRGRPRNGNNPFSIPSMRRPLPPARITAPISSRVIMTLFAAQTREELHEVAGLGAAVELLLQDVVPGEATGIGRAGYAENKSGVGDAREHARLHGGGLDLRVGEMAKQLAETVDFFIEQRTYRLRGLIARGEARAAGDDHRLHRGVGDPARDLRAHLIEVVGNDHLVGEAMPCGLQSLHQQAAGGVCLFVACVGHGEHRDSDRNKRCLFTTRTHLSPL